MLLFLDVRNTGATVGAIEQSSHRWVTVAGDRAGLLAYAKARTKFGFGKSAPNCIVVAMNGPGATRDVSWSGVRAGIATANALAFAWGVPVAAVAVHGDETPDALAVMVRAAAKAAVPGIWVSASYSGEPNITMPKSTK